MFKNKRVTLKILIVLIFIDTLEAFVQFCYKKSSLVDNRLEIKTVHDVLTFVMSMIFSPFMWLGTLIVLLIFVMWSTILSKIDLSVAIPIASLNFISDFPTEAINSNI